MKIHHLRNATLVIESQNAKILIDPMLGGVGELPPFARFRHESQRNPTVALPESASAALADITHCLITHSQTFGIRALQHSDHLDESGEQFLKENNVPVVCREQDASYLKKYGMNVAMELEYWMPHQFLNGKITAVPAQHGHGWIHWFMANGAGFYLALADEPSIYISGDTVYTGDVRRALRELKPEIAVVAAGSASLDVGGPILMPLEEVVDFVRDAPGTVVANHLEALNHCPTERTDLRRMLESEGLLSKSVVPEDGETILFGMNGQAAG